MTAQPPSPLTTASPQQASANSPHARAPGLHPPLLHTLPRNEQWEGPEVEEVDEIGLDEPARRRGWKRLLHPIILFVVLPTLSVAAFEYLVAANQYESTAQFIVKTPQPTNSVSSLGQMLGIGSSSSPADAHSVEAYLLSHDAVDALGRARLVDMFRRPEADQITRLWFAKPEPETLHRFYRGQIDLTTASDSGITTLAVRSFRREDAKALAKDLLKLGERHVNLLNQRMYDEGLSAATRQVREAEALVQKAESDLTAFRQARRDASPEQTGAAQIQLAASLQQQASQARAQFEAMAAVLPPTAPQYSVTARKVASLDRQVAAAKARLAGTDQSLAGGLGEYEDLQMRQQLAAKQFEAAQASFQSAREQLLKQQLYLVPVVEPNFPGKALFPKRLTIVATVFFGLLFAYAIGWLILAGLREHAE